MNTGAIKLLRRIGIADLDDPELVPWLDSLYHPEMISDPNRVFTTLLTDDSIETAVGIDEYARNWLRYHEEDRTDTEHDRLFHVSAAQFSYPHYLGRILPELWRRFFREYPSGQVWIFDLAECLSDPFESKLDLFDRSEPRQARSALRLAVTSAQNGLDVSALPYFALAFLASSIHPLILCDSVLTYDRYLLLYVPDRSLRYSVMLEGNSAYQRVLWKLLDVFDDGETYGDRGPKWQVSAQRISPIANLDYIEWFTSTLGCRMRELDGICDLGSRIQLTLTISRLFCDAILCLTSELPYMSKMFFFAFLDKLANVSARWENVSDTQAWLSLVDRRHLMDCVLPTLSSISGTAGDYFRAVVDGALAEMGRDDLTPEELRAIRNSSHGYFLKSESLEQLMRHTGEFSNDVTLLVAPLMLNLLSMQWH